MKFICLSLLIIMTPECYKVSQVSKLEPYLKSESRTVHDYDSQLKTNYAFVYYLKSGQVLLLPNNRLGDSKGLLFSNKQCFSECVKKDHFPIENEKPVIEEKYQPVMLAINRNIGGIIKHLSSITGASQHPGAIDTPALSRLLQHLQRKWKKLSKEDLVYTALTFGEYLRRVHSGKWILLKSYGTFNPYYTPAILYPDNSIFLFWDYFNGYLTFGVTPEIYANVQYVKTPGFKLDNNIYTQCAGYRILPDEGR